MDENKMQHDDGLETTVLLSRFCDLPREIRDEIYRYCLEPEFRQSFCDNVHPSYRVPILEACPYPYDEDWAYCCNSIVLSHTPFESYFVYDEKPQTEDEGGSILTYRLGEATSLLLVSKQINEEVSQILKKLYPILDSAIDTHHIVSPSAAFLDLCSQARFIFDAGPTRALNFINNLPTPIKPLVHDVALISSCVYEESHDFWIRHNNNNTSYGDTSFSETLCTELPNLRSLAIEVPGDMDGYNKGYMAGAPYSLSKLLLAGRIDVARLLYRRRCLDGRGSTDQDIIHKNFGRLDDVETPLAHQSYILTPMSSMEACRFNVVEVSPWKIGERGGWFDEEGKMERLVEITRWQDRRQSTST